MPQYTAPIDDIEFVLHDVLKVSTSDLPGYSDLSEDLTRPLLEEAGKLARDVIAPLNLTGDREGCKLVDGKVQVPSGFPEAFDALREGGWTSFDFDPAYGGEGMPGVFSMAVNEIFTSANLSLMMYPGLTRGARSAILAHGSEEQKNTYLPKMATCDWTGTMNLTEPHCGTDLGLMRTKAEPQDDGSYKITGTKIFISSGDHEMAENIVHLVLAKVPGAPEGIKGVSLFIVPKYHVNADGTLGERNAVAPSSLENKMGIHGNATCVMSFDGATGYMLGEANKGMRGMFTMMNLARIGTGAQGLCQASAAYQNALAYAQDRLQGRAVTGVENPDGPADPIIVHPDVRRSLMDQKAFVEGARTFTLLCSTLGDQIRGGVDVEQAEGLVGLLTPVLKAFLTDKGYEAATNAQQIFGGHGYVEEAGMSQFVRDARIAMIYEGANGVQALDLVGRKLGANGGKSVMAYGKMLKETADRLCEDERLKDDFGTPLLAALGDFQNAVGYLMQNGMSAPNAALAGATDFLHLMGHLTFGYVLALNAEAAQKALDDGREPTEFYQQKIMTARHYFLRHLPMTRMCLKRVQAGPDTIMTPAVSAF